jgi:hypothetical protein
MTSAVKYRAAAAVIIAMLNNDSNFENFFTLSIPSPDSTLAHPLGVCRSGAQPHDTKNPAGTNTFRLHLSQYELRNKMILNYRPFADLLHIGVPDCIIVEFALHLGRLSGLHE